MPDCQSGAVHSLVCGTIICMAVAGDMGVCHANCHEGIAAEPCAIRAAAVSGAPVSFQCSFFLRYGPFKRGGFAAPFERTRAEEPHAVLWVTSQRV